MRKCEEVLAGEVADGDDLVNMGEVTAVLGSGDAVLIEWRGPWSRLIGANSIRGMTYDVGHKLYRFLSEEGE